MFALATMQLARRDYRVMIYDDEGVKTRRFFQTLIATVSKEDLSRDTVLRWYNKFQRGRLSLEDDTLIIIFTHHFITFHIQGTAFRKYAIGTPSLSPPAMHIQSHNFVCAEIQCQTASFHLLLQPPIFCEAVSSFRNKPINFHLRISKHMAIPLMNMWRTRQ